MPSTHFIAHKRNVVAFNYYFFTGLCYHALIFLKRNKIILMKKSTTCMELFMKLSDHEIFVSNLL